MSKQKWAELKMVGKAIVAALIAVTWLLAILAFLTSPWGGWIWSVGAIFVAYVIGYDRGESDEMDRRPY